MLWLISKFMTSQIGQQIIIIHILSNISGTKVNKTMKFRQLIEYNRNIFLEKSSIKCDADGTPGLFYKKSILRISLDCLKCYKSVLTVRPSEALPK